MFHTRCCPACARQDSQLLTELEFGDFDGNDLSRVVSLFACPRCGFVFNHVPGGPASLETFYTSQALYSAEMGVGSGGSSPSDLERYESALSFIAPSLSSAGSSICDVGCAKGGFLSHLRERGYHNLMGVNLSPACVAHLRDQVGIEARVGAAGSIPLLRASQDLVMLSHVLEHVFEPAAVLEEARDKAADGAVFVEVPDASRYSEVPISEYYWLSQREHINHMGPEQLDSLLVTNGLVVERLECTTIPISDSLRQPVIRALARPGPSGDATSDFELRASIERYLHGQARGMSGRRDALRALVTPSTPVYPWGIGLEFFALYTLGGLRECDIVALVDRNEDKRRHTVDGKPIVPPTALLDVGEDAFVVVTASLHKSAMLEWLRENNFRGQTLVLV